jgi:hypothetical protein
MSVITANVVDTDHTDRPRAGRAPATAERRRVWIAGVLAGLVAAAATSTTAAIARASGAGLAVDDERIPVGGFAMLTVIGAVFGIAIAAVSRRSGHPRRAFVRVTVALTGLSIVPDLVADATWTTRLILAATHVVAAAIVVPALAHRLER